MKLRSITARAAGAGAVTALIAGGLVVATDVTANAETATSTYTCSAPGTPSTYVSDFAIKVDGGLPVPQFFGGAPVPAGLVSVTVTSQLTTDQATALGGLGITGAHSNDFALKFGSNSVPLPIKGNFDSGSGSTVWTATGSNKPFTTPNPGAPDIVLPSSFTMTTENASGDFIPLACVIKAGDTPAKLVTGFPLARQLSKTTATGVSGKRPTVAVKVVSSSWGATVPTGKVVAKEGTKVVGSATLKRGKAVITLISKLKPGKHKLSVAYAGTKSLKGSTARVTVTKKR